MTDTPGTPLTPSQEARLRRLVDRADAPQWVRRLLATLDRERRERVDPSTEVWRLGEHAPDPDHKGEPGTADCLVCGQRWPCEPYRFLMELATEAQNARRERVDPDLRAAAQDVLAWATARGYNVEPESAPARLRAILARQPDEHGTTTDPQYLAGWNEAMHYQRHANRVADDLGLARQPAEHGKPVTPADLEGIYQPDERLAEYDRLTAARQPR